MAANTQKPKIRIRHIMGGVHEAVETGEYPDYYLIRSRKYAKSWKIKEFPAELKFKGEIVYTIEDEFTIQNRKGKPVEDVEFVMEICENWIAYLY